MNTTKPKKFNASKRSTFEKPPTRFEGSSGLNESSEYEGPKVKVRPVNPRMVDSDKTLSKEESVTRDKTVAVKPRMVKSPEMSMIPEKTEQSEAESTPKAKKAALKDKDYYAIFQESLKVKTPNLKITKLDSKPVRSNSVRKVTLKEEVLYHRPKIEPVSISRHNNTYIPAVSYTDHRVT